MFVMMKDGDLSLSPFQIESEHQRPVVQNRDVKFLMVFPSPNPAEMLMPKSLTFETTF
jgi:hypothetical protein